MNAIEKTHSLSLRATSITSIQKLWKEPYLGVGAGVVLNRHLIDSGKFWQHADVKLQRCSC